jgi:hypothetical protein
MRAVEGARRAAGWRLRGEVRLRRRVGKGRGVVQ